VLKQKRKTQKKKRSRATREQDNGHPHYHYESAITMAQLGEADSAFWCLKKALRLGFRDCKLLRTDKGLKTLRTDKRWSAIEKKCKANMDAFLRAVNVELYRMCQRDKADRGAENLDPEVVQKRNARRLKKVRRMLDAGDLKVADDFYHAASILYNGADSSDYELARKLALRTVKLNPKHYDAKALAAMSKDRYLHSVGKPQIYGTQFKIEKGELTLEPFDRNAVTQREREKWSVSHLCWMLRSMERSDKSKK
jgi:hypothetical protein